jgi:hypothetical protein
MRRFFSNLSLFAFLFFLLLLLFKFAFINYNKKDYLSTFVDKIDNLKKSSNEKRLIIIGTSSTAFGISASRLSDKFKKRCLNLGTHGGLGILNQLELIQKYSNKNDTFLLEVDLGFDFFQHVPQKMDELRYNNPKYNLHTEEYVDFFISLIKYNLGKPKTYGTYNYYGVNQSGDITTNCIDTFTFPNKISKLKEVDKTKILEYFSLVFKYIDKDRTYLILPPLQHTIYNKNRELYRTYSNVIENEFSGRVLNSLNETIYDNYCFFDGPPHLNCETRDIRTQGIINKLDEVRK